MASCGRILGRISTLKVEEKSFRFDLIRQFSLSRGNFTSEETEVKSFRVFRFRPEKRATPIATTTKSNKFRPRNTPRAWLMQPDQDWTNVWPGPRTFHPGVVPLPIRQGCRKKGIPPWKTANAELMKIPNFLHLTPAAIKKHCEAIKKFCTEWPENLDLNKFPIQVITSDYCHSSPSIRDPQSRIVTIKVKLDDLDLDQHARDKFLRLVAERYDPETNSVTITTDSCPLKKQNYDYAMYLLTALFFESWRYEDWEKKKSHFDMEEYIFKERKSLRNVIELFKSNKMEVPENLDFYAEALEDCMNKEENLELIDKYKKAAMKLLSLPSLEDSRESNKS